ncbi:MAG: hypothetical protein AAF414_13850 [Pseudomonadota bacterium]
MKLRIGSISGRGDVRIEFVHSLFEIQKECTKLGIETEFDSMSGALVEDARNTLATRFLNSDADAIFMMDDDVAVDIRVFKRLLAFERGVVGCYYPQRKLDLQAVFDLVRNGTDFVEATERVNPPVGSDPQKATPSSISEVDWIGTGALLVRRFVFETLIRGGHVAEDIYRAPEGTVSNWGFFSRIHSTGDGLGPRGEDVSFCMRVRKAGIPVFAYKGPGVFHVGTQRFGFEYR